MDVGGLEARHLCDLLGGQMPEVLERVCRLGCLSDSRHAHEAFPDGGLEALELAENPRELRRLRCLDSAFEGGE